MFRLTLYQTFLILLTLNTYSQKEKNFYNNVLNAFAKNDNEEAVKSFRQTQKINKGDEDVSFKIAYLSLLLPEGNNKPLDEIINCESICSDTDHRYYYRLVLIQLLKHQREDTVNFFGEFHRNIKWSGNVDEESQALIARSKSLQYHFNTISNFEIHQLDAINSAYNELKPVFFEESDELLFESDRDGSGETLYNIYYSSKSKAEWSSLQQLINIGRFTKENANIEVLNGDEKIFLFREKKGNNLFYSWILVKNWSTTQEFDAKVSNFPSAYHSFIYKHEDRMVFAANVNRTGLDVFESSIDLGNDKLSKPIPFHSSITTKSDEASPYLSLKDFKT